MNDTWEYKDHLCEIEEDVEYDDEGNIEVVKHFHYVIAPDGKRHMVHLSPYNIQRFTVEAWIDAGYPDRDTIGRNFLIEDLLIFERNVLDSKLSDTDRKGKYVGYPKTTKEAPDWRLKRDGWVGIYSYRS